MKKRKHLFTLIHKLKTMTQKQKDTVTVTVIIIISLLIENLIKF